jgi:iron complex outermembrane receptor protein
MRTVCIAAFALIFAAAGFAQAPAEPAEPAEDAAPAQGGARPTPPPMEEYVVTGTRAADRTVIETPVPVDVLPGEEIQQSGAIAGELGSALQLLAPSFNIQRQSQSGPADHIRAAQLRGMSPDQTLVLVNGKRRHISSVVQLESKLGRGTTPVDLNSIPLAAIGRIEILRDGASAQYGSDAIAGVINILLDERAEGVDASVSYGEHLTDFAPTNDRLHDGETWNASLSAGFGLPNEGFLRVGAEWKDREATVRGGKDGGAPFLYDGAPFDAANIATFGRVNFEPGDGDLEDVNLWVNGEMPFTEDTSFYLFGTFGSRDTEGVGFYRYPSSAQNVRSIYPNGFLPITTGDNLDYAFVMGLRSVLAGFDVDASLNYGRNRFDFGLENSINASLGTASPTEFDLGRYSYDQVVANLDFVREVGIATVAFGFEYRDENFETSAGDPESYAVGPLAPVKDANSQAAPGLRPEDTVDNSRDVGSVYADVAFEPFERLFVEVAGRYEYYDDFGDQLTGKLSGRYELVPGYAVRGAVSTNFRAPTLSQIGFAQGVTTFGVTSGLSTVGTLPVDDPLAQALGAEDLDAEESTNYSLGVTGELLPGVTLSVDGFLIYVDDRITLSEAIDATGTPDPRGRDFDAVNFFTNAVDTRTAGVDVVLTYEAALGDGTLASTLAYSHAKTDILHSDNEPGLIRIGPEETNTIEDAVPHNKFVGTWSWENDWLRLMLRAIHYGKVERVFAFFPAGANSYGPEWQFDGEVGVTVLEGVRLSVGGINLLDEYPDRQDANYNAAGNFPYDVITPLGFNGRFVYARLDLSF